MTHSLRRLVTQPGFNCVCCCIGESVAGGMSLRIQQIDCRCETKTKDNVFVDINITVQYQIERENLYDAFYKLTDSRWVVGLGGLSLLSLPSLAVAGCAHSSSSSSSLFLLLFAGLRSCRWVLASQTWWYRLAATPPSHSLVLAAILCSMSSTRCARRCPR